MVLSFVFEALLISLVGGLLGCVAVLPLNGLTTGAMNWQTFSHLAFAFGFQGEVPWRMQNERVILAKPFRQHRVRGGGRTALVRWPRGRHRQTEAAANGNPPMRKMEGA